MAPLDALLYKPFFKLSPRLDWHNRLSSFAFFPNPLPSEETSFFECGHAEEVRFEVDFFPPNPRFLIRSRHF